MHRSEELLGFQWQKQGKIFVSDGRYEWMQQYAQVPTALLLDDRIRLYFACRPKPDSDGNYVSYTTFLEVDRSNLQKVLYVHDRPIIPLGNVGAFDQYGVMPCCVIRHHNEVWIYYVGWARTRGVPWHSSIGLAISNDGGKTFRKYGEGPILTRTPLEPYVHGSPFVMQIEDVYHLWYLVGTKWVQHDGRTESIYRLKHAVSSDGIDWKRDRDPCISTLQENECQARPAVVSLGDRYHMWFSYRHGVDFRNAARGYGIGYAWTDDLQVWHREDQLGGLIRSSDGWDSEMVSYPNILQVDDQLIAFYCGNYMGREGFGCATARIPSTV